MRSDAFRLLAAAALVAAQGFAPRASGAQAHFPPPSDRANYAHYTMPEQCLAAVVRVTDSVRWRDRRDTLPYDPHEPLPAVTVETARRCMAPFSVAKADTVSLHALRDLALAAGDDSMSAHAVARELANARTAPLTFRAAILQSALRSSLDARPVRLDGARRYAAQLDALGPEVSQARFEAHANIVSTLLAELSDLDAILREVTALGDLLQRTPPDVRAGNPEFWQQAELLSRFGLVQMTELRDGPAAGLAELKARGWDAGTMLGKRARTITATSWFNRPDAADRPRPGRISLVVFADPFCGAQCFPFYATLRRLARAHPDVEITVVAQTRGFFGGLLPANPGEEAELDRKYLLDFHKLPGALAVDSTPHTALPAPDGRRLNQLARNNASYGLPQSGLGMANPYPGDVLEYFLVGPDGIIDFASTVWPTNERLIDAQIAAIRRSTASDR